MKRVFRKALLVAACLVCGATVVSAHQGEAVSAPQNVVIGGDSPSFSYQDINGKIVSLADLKGKPVYIDIWATWCPPCRAELPHLLKLEEKYGDKIYFVSISCDQDKAKWTAMVKEKGLKGIQLHMGKDRSLMQAYSVTGIPRFILLDAEGKIVSDDMTRPSQPETAQKLESLIKK